MISFCLITEDEFDTWQGSPVKSTAEYENPQDYIKGLESDLEYGRKLFAARKGTENSMSGPGDSLWSWVPWSDESNAENKIDDTEAMIRRIKNEPELFYTYKNGSPNPGFFDHPYGYTENMVLDNKAATALAASGLTAAAYFANKARQQSQPSPDGAYQANSSGNGGGPKRFFGNLFGRKSQEQQPVNRSASSALNSDNYVPAKY